MNNPHVERLGLLPHPEGGYYKECYRSQISVSSNDRQRDALTVIYYLLEAGQYSAWHRVLSDEVWHYYDGEDLELFSMTPDCKQVERILLNAENRHAVIPAEYWQAAKPIGTFALTGCCVSPGFDFKDFILLRDHPRSTDIEKQWQELL